MLSKISKTLLFLGCFLLMGEYSLAHQQDLSTMILSKENGKYILQINCSLAAFEGEIDYKFSKDAYKTPQEFQELVIKHFYENLEIIINGNKMNLVNPIVILGHETKFIAEVTGVPSKIDAIEIENTGFSDIPNHQMAVFLLGTEFPFQQYNLNKENKQHIELKKRENQWQLSKNRFSTSELFYILLVISSIISILYLVFRKSNTKTILS